MVKIKRTKTYEVKEAGFVSNFINARSKNESIKRFKKRYGYYGGGISTRLSEYNMVGKLRKKKLNTNIFS